jgi:hypothetical protein
MKRMGQISDAASGTEVGLYLVPRTRMSVGPAALTSTPYCRLGSCAPEHAFQSSMTWAARRCRRDMEAIMDVIYPRCAGLDVHKQTVVAVRAHCRWRPRRCRRCAPSTRPPRDCWPWPTGWTPWRVEHVAMEATGVYWKPVWHVLEGPLRAGAGQRRARQERPRPQDRRQRRDVAGRPAGPRPDPCQLRAPGGGAGTAHADPHPQAVRARGRLPRPAHREECSKTPTSSSAP